MTDPLVGYGCCVGSWEKYDKYVRPHAQDKGRPTMTSFGATSIAEVYNEILESFSDAGQTSFLDALILLHDDLEIIDPDAEAKFLEAVNQPDVALVGVCGGDNVRSLDWWVYDTCGHQQIETVTFDFGDRTGEVDSLEGSILVFSPWAIEHLRFDKRFDKFHGYDEISMQARHWHGKRNLVIDVDTFHHTYAGFKTDAEAAEWARCNTMFKQKWGFE